MEDYQGLTTIEKQWKYITKEIKKEKEACVCDEVSNLGCRQRRQPGEQITCIMNVSCSVV